MALCIKCAYCGDEFIATRRTAKYCSDNCRVKYNNIDSQLAGYLGTAIMAIENIQKVLEEYPEFTVQIDSDLQGIIRKATSVQFSIDPHELRKMQNNSDL